MTDELEYVNVVVDSQVLSTFMACHRKANYIFNLHLVPVEGHSASINKGLLMHDGLSGYFKARVEQVSHKDALSIGLKAMRDKAPTQTLDAEDVLLVYRTYEEFLNYRVATNTWIPIAAEKYFKFVAYQDDVLRLRVVLTGRIDLLEMDPKTNIIYPFDHKTESETWFYSQLKNQFKIYSLACGSPATIVNRIGFQKTLKPEQKFKQETINYDPDVMDEFKNEVLPYYAKELLVCSETEYWAPNYASCISGHFACVFSDKYHGGICNVSRSLREERIARHFTVGEEWNPEEF